MEKMNLNLEIIVIKDACFGNKTYIENGVLTINKEELIKEVKIYVSLLLILILQNPVNQQGLFL